MADAAAADCVGNDPLRVQRDAAPSTLSLRHNKATTSASHSQSASPSSSSSHHRSRPRVDRTPTDDESVDDAASVASSTGTAGRKHNTPAAESRKPDSTAKEPARQTQQQTPQQQQQQQQQQATGVDQQLRKSASASTTASARTNTSTEVRAAVSNRASHSALTRNSLSPTSSPATSFSSRQEVDEDLDAQHHLQLHSSAHAHGIGLSYPNQAPAAESAPPSRFHHSHPPPGIIQVNPAPASSASSTPQPRGRPQMASSFIPSFFARRRPTSSASSVHSSSFAAPNPSPPGPGAFDFNSILNSLDSDTAAQADIDAIAEICGRSRLSLANAHANHRGPVGELVGTDISASANMLETVREGGTPGREEERRLGGSRAGSAAAEDRWRSGGSETYDERDGARQSSRGAVSGVVAYASSPRIEEEGRARRHLMRVRDVSNEREQRRRQR